MQRVCGKDERDVGMAHCGKWSSGGTKGDGWVLTTLCQCANWHPSDAAVGDKSYWASADRTIRSWFEVE